MTRRPARSPFSPTTVLFRAARARKEDVQIVVALTLMYGAAAHVCKAILSERLGIDMGESIRPNNYLTAEEKAHVLAEAKKAGALDAPVATAV